MPKMADKPACISSYLTKYLVLSFLPPSIATRPSDAFGHSDERYRTICKHQSL